MVLSSNCYSGMITQLESFRKEIDKPIADWLKEQGYKGGFDSRKHQIILPTHMKALFSQDYPYVKFSEYLAEDDMCIVNMSNNAEFKTYEI